MPRKSRSRNHRNAGANLNLNLNLAADIGADIGADIDTWYKPPVTPICPLCQREIPPAQSDEHHLIPRMKGGKHTTALHRICHRQIHALFSESELAQHYSTIESLLTSPDIQTFVKWVSSKPNGFCDSAKMSVRKR